jgi:outer membrane protein OmpA-like peptidoglycan-associated protein
LKDGSANTLKIVYNTFGDIDVKLYPTLMPTYPSADSVIDGSFLKDVASATPAAQLASADVQKYSNTYDISQKISEKAWAIEFQSGNANLTPKAAKTLDSIANQSIIASGTRLKLTGYTDNVGNPSSNVTLSQARAESVKAWLQAKYSSSFPDSRVSTDGQGDANPIADNSSALGRAKNRRVVVLMGK